MRSGSRPSNRALIVFDILNREEVFSVISLLPTSPVEMNQDNAEMNLNKIYITFDYPSGSPKANPSLSDTGGSRRQKS